MMTQIRYRVECNFGSKYFNRKLDAVIYFNYCRARKLECEIWQMKKTSLDSVYSHIQVLLANYSPQG